MAKRCTADPGPSRRRRTWRSAQVGLSDLRAFERRSRASPRSVSAAHHFARTQARADRETCPRMLHAAQRPGYGLI